MLKTMLNCALALSAICLCNEAIKASKRSYRISVMMTAEGDTEEEAYINLKELKLITGFKLVSIADIDTKELYEVPTSSKQKTYYTSKIFVFVSGSNLSRVLRFFREEEDMYVTEVR